MKLVAYSLENSGEWEIKLSRPTRSWMDDTPQKYAYRCLPMTIANQAGWVICCPATFEVEWSGTKALDSVSFRFEQASKRFEPWITSHFGDGIITFSLPYLFRTDSPMGLLVRGIPNSPKCNCNPLEGYVETYWGSFSFTMNWKINNAGIPIRFERGEPVCFIQPYDVRWLEIMEPRIADLNSEPTLAVEYEAWRSQRHNFIKTLPRASGWQKTYMQGNHPNGSSEPNHRTKLRLNNFLKPE